MVQRKRRRNKLAIVAGASGLAAVCAVTVSLASANASPTEQQCAVNTSNNEQKCFDSQEEAQAYVNQQIRDRALSAQTAVEKPTDVVIGTLYEHWRYGGRSIILWGSRPCDGKTAFYYNLPDDWKNQVSAVQGWATCQVTLYSRPYLEGEPSPAFKDLTPILDGPWNDYAQSIEFK